jgi:hypothetical protein
MSTRTTPPAPRPKKVTSAKARRAIEAITAVVECDDVDGSDLVALEDARAVLAQWEDA